LGQGFICSNIFFVQPSPGFPPNSMLRPGMGHPGMGHPSRHPRFPGVLPRHVFPPHLANQHRPRQPVTYPVNDNNEFEQVFNTTWCFNPVVLSLCFLGCLFFGPFFNTHFLTQTFCVTIFMNFFFRKLTAKNAEICLNVNIFCRV